MGFGSFPHSSARSLNLTSWWTSDNTFFLNFSHVWIFTILLGKSARDQLYLFLWWSGTLGPTTDIKILVVKQIEQ